MASAAEKKTIGEALDKIENELRAVRTNDRQPVVNAHNACAELRDELSIESNGDE